MGSQFLTTGQGPDRSKVLSIQAQDLQQGDLVLPTNRRVIWAGQTAHTPSGKVTIRLIQRTLAQTVHWNKHTMITVWRERVDGN